MDKNRTDLLAAGRKRLQQFRQKKDGKGNSTKSSAKSGKSGHHSTATSDNTSVTDELSARSGIPEILPAAGDVELNLAGSGVDTSKSNQSDGGDGRGFDSEVLDLNDTMEGASDSMIIVEKLEDSSTSLPVESLSERGRQDGNEPETDVGAMQEVVISSESPVDLGSVSTANSLDTDKPSEDLLSGFSNEEKTEMLDVSYGHTSFVTDGAHASSDFNDVERLSELRKDETAEALACKQVDLSSVLDGSVVKLSHLVGILRLLDDDEFKFLFMSRELPLEKFRDTDEINVRRDAFERLKEQLYVTSFSRDACHLQLHYSEAEVEGFSAEVNELQRKIDSTQGEMSSLYSELVDCRNLVEALQSENENLNGSLKVTTAERNKLREENEIIRLEKEKTTGELAQSKASSESLQILLRDDMRLLEEKNDDLVRENSKLIVDLEKFTNTVEVLELENRNLNEILISVSEERNKLEEDREVMVRQNENMSKELMDYKDLVVNLQFELSNFNGRLISVNEERIAHEEEKESIFSEYEKQSLQLVESKIVEAVLLAECSKAVDKVKEAISHVNQLAGENEAINFDLEFQKTKLEDSYRKEYASQSEEVANRGVENDICALQKSKSDSYRFMALKRKLGDAEIVMQKLKKEIEGMHSHLTFLNRSGDKVVAPGVSRLIQAFESKCTADDQDPEKSTSSESYSTEDSYTRTKMATDNLRMMIKELIDEFEYYSEFFEVMQNKPDRSECGSPREHTDQFERANIELMILYEVIREHISHVNVKECERLSSFDALQKQELDLKSENNQLRKKLNNFEARISELQSQLDGICRNSDEMIASISKQVQIIEAEVDGRESFLEEWNSVCAKILQAVGVLDSTIETFSVNSLTGEDDSLDIVGSVSASVDGATKMIENLHGQLEAVHRESREISDRNDMALRTMRTLYDELHELVSEKNSENDKVLDLFCFDDGFSTLLDRLKDIFGDKLRIESENIKLVEEIEESVRPKGIDVNIDEPPASRLESLIRFLILKYKEADRNVSLSASLEMQLNEAKRQVEHLNLVLVHYENENFIFKQSLKSAEDEALALSRKVRDKVAALEMSEQRVLSLREKLSIAVTKGKGLISQRDSLKQTLADTSKELEKSSHELLSKDDRLNELETKLNVYSEAGERMEALESELSYIRNSATALRESFLLKDSVIQRIEEILEDLELPDQFHSGNVIEKIEWLAKSVEGGSYADAGFVGIDGFKEDTHTDRFSVDDLRIRYEELQNKFYGLAEQNETLEQSLLQRNNLVQRWEEILDGVDLPSQLRSVEPEYKIEWMGRALSTAQEQCYSLIAYLEDSQRRTSELASVFQQSCVEKEILSMDLQILSRDINERVRKTADLKLSNENLRNEIIVLQEQKLRMEEDVRRNEGILSRLQELVKNVPVGSEDVIVNLGGVENFEEILSKLVEKYEALSSGKPVNVNPIDVVTLSKNLEESMDELVCLREEREKIMVENQSLLRKVEELETIKREMQDLLNLEEQKSASSREKLNIAVRKGKSLVQQRDGMKKAIEELNAEVERLKSEVNRSEKVISENAVLRDSLAEAKRSMLDALNEIDVGHAFDSENPVGKLNRIGQCLHDLRTGHDFLEQESRKSKRAAELLLTELNEVRERNNGFQEELAKAVHEKNEALAHIEKLSYVHSEENDRQLAEIMVLKSCVDSTREDLSAVEREVGNVLSEDLEILRSMKAVMKSFSELGGNFEFRVQFHDSFAGGISLKKSKSKVFKKEIGSLGERLYNHAHLLRDEVSQLSEVLKNVYREYTSHKELCESMKSIEKEKESESNILRGNISRLYETCSISISEIENWKDRAAGNASVSRIPVKDLKSRNSLFNDAQILNEEGVTDVCEKLLLLVGDFVSMRSELVEGGQMEMKSTISNLQKELHEKDMQTERICMELVNQIKEAEIKSNNYSHDLEQARANVHDLQRQLDVMADERKVLEQKVNSLRDALTAKTQENDALMQALDEQEAEMEDVTKKIGDLENELRQTKHDFDNLEASRAKALKKLSVTVNKFDELHHFSESLLAEVEKLQSRLRERDGEISFLRQEVTRCTDDALAVTQMSKQTSSDEILGLLSWLDSLLPQVDDAASDDLKSSPAYDYKEVLRKKVMDLISELENLRAVARASDTLLQEERSKVEEFEHKEEYLKTCLREKESELAVLQGAVKYAKATKSTSEIVETEQMTNKWASPGNVIPQVRSLRKSNNDQVAIAIDVDHNSDRLDDDDDDDKAHGFKSLTTSKIVPRFTRPVSDFVDGLWVSCDRALMRQPALRLGVIIYWALLHAMLATFVV